MHFTAAYCDFVVGSRPASPAQGDGGGSMALDGMEPSEDGSGSEMSQEELVSEFFNFEVDEEEPAPGRAVRTKAARPRRRRGRSKSKRAGQDMPQWCRDALSKKATTRHQP